MDKYQLFLSDVMEYIRERALDAKNKKSNTKKGTEDYYFASGRLMGYNEVISIVKQHAVGFMINESEIHTEDIDPDRDLI